VTVVSVAPLRVEAYRELVRQALAEDIGRGDVTTAATVDDRQQARAELVAKSACVLAGLDVFCEALRQCDPHVERLEPAFQISCALSLGGAGRDIPAGSSPSSHPFAASECPSRWRTRPVPWS